MTRMTTKKNRTEWSAKTGQQKSGAVFLKSKIEEASDEDD